MEVVRKEVLMVQNLRLLGFDGDDAGAAARSGAGRGGPELHAGAFDRPNEKLLLRVLHFLLVTQSPDAAQVRGFSVFAHAACGWPGACMGVILTDALGCCTAFNVWSRSSGFAGRSRRRTTSPTSRDSCRCAVSAGQSGRVLLGY